jgi:glucose-1-phosphate cytidylyltransferase
MKAVILAGGYGSRLSEETLTIPKPMVEIGGHPILWHIMKIYAAYGIEEFVICCGYKGVLIKRYFLDYFHANSDLTIDLNDNSISIIRPATERWRVTLVDTGQDTMTGGRIRRIRDEIGGDTFCLTYGDGVADIDIRRLVAFHKDQGTEATVTAVQQPGRFGSLNLSDNNTRVAGFREKNILDGQVINGGYFVLEPSVFDRIEGDDTVWEEAPLRGLVADSQLSVYRHHGYWQNMDTLRDKTILQNLWAEGRAPWKIWDDAADSQPEVTHARSLVSGDSA